MRRGLASTRANVSCTRSSASSRDPHSAHAARYKRSTWSPSPAGSRTRVLLLTRGAGYEPGRSAGAALSVLIRRGPREQLRLSTIYPCKYHGWRDGTQERDAPAAVPGQRGLGAHARALPRLAPPLPRRRVRVRPLAAPGPCARRARPRAAGADERARRGAALRQLERHGHRGPPRGPRPRRAPQRDARPAGEEAGGPRARGRGPRATGRAPRAGAGPAGPPLAGGSAHPPRHHAAGARAVLTATRGRFSPAPLPVVDSRYPSNAASGRAGAP